MIKPDQKAIEAAKRLIRDADFIAVLVWLENCRQSEIASLTVETDAGQMRVQQGRLQAIKAIKDLADAAENL